MTTARLNYDLAGPPGAPPLLLVGSLGTTMAMWEPQLAALCGEFRVLRAEPRGHGGSDVLPGPYTIRGLAGDVLALLDRVGLPQVSYCGQSLGGMIGMWLAAHEPGRIGRLAVCCTSAWLPPAKAWTIRAEHVRAQGTASIADQVLDRWFSAAFRAANPAAVTWASAMLAATPAEGYAGCCEAIAAMDLRPALGAISAPTLVISGSADPATPPAHGAQIAAAIAGAQLAVVPAAHLANIEAPLDVSTRLLAHLAG
jgi:3-oxoadipate enol-lactonase